VASGSLPDRVQNALRVSLAAGPGADRKVANILKTGSQRLAGATITVGAEATNVREIAIQLTDENGDDLDHVASLPCYLLSSNTTYAQVVTGGSTGLALGTGGNGALHTVLTKKVFNLVSEANGDIDL